LVRAVAVDGKDAKLQRRLGLAQRKLGRSPEAIAALTRALELDAKMIDLEPPLGELHRAAGRRAAAASDHATAASELANARKYQRDDADVCVEQANSLRALERFDEAAAAALRATELAEGRADVRSEEHTSELQSP